MSGRENSRSPRAPSRDSPTGSGHDGGQPVHPAEGPRSWLSPRGDNRASPAGRESIPPPLPLPASVGEGGPQALLNRSPQHGSQHSSVNAASPRGSPVRVASEGPQARKSGNDRHVCLPPLRPPRPPGPPPRGGGGVGTTHAAPPGPPRRPPPPPPPPEPTHTW